jgi:hypothetical protein
MVVGWEDSMLLEDTPTGIGAAIESGWAPVENTGVV